MDESLHQAAVGDGAVVFEPRRALDAARAWARARACVLVCVALLAFMSLQMLSVVWQKSITVDEVVMIPAAYYHLAAANCQLVHEHPPLVKILAGLPLLLLQPDETDPAKLGHAPDSPVGKWTYCERFWDDNPRLFESISFWARVPMIALSVLTGFLLFAFARDLFGEAAAVLAVALYTLEPTLLAHGRVVQTDVAGLVRLPARLLRAPQISPRADVAAGAAARRGGWSGLPHQVLDADGRARRRRRPPRALVARAAWHGVAQTDRRARRGDGAGRAPRHQRRLLLRPPPARHGGRQVGA